MITRRNVVYASFQPCSAPISISHQFSVRSYWSKCDVNLPILGMPIVSGFIISNKVILDYIPIIVVVKQYYDTM